MAKNEPATLYRADARMQTSERVAELMRRPAHVLRRLVSLVLRGKSVRARGIVTFADPNVALRAKELGFRHVGALEEVLGFKRNRRELWVDADGIVQLHSSVRFPYFLATYFDDGSGIITWFHPTPLTPTTPILVSSPGTGVLDTDLERHADAIAQWTALRACAPLPVLDIETAANMVRHYYLHIVPLSVVTPILWSIVLLPALVAGVLYVLARWLLR